VPSVNGKILFHRRKSVTLGLEQHEGEYMMTAFSCLYPFKMLHVIVSKAVSCFISHRKKPSVKITERKYIKMPPLFSHIIE